MFVHAAGDAIIGTASSPVTGVINVTGTTSTNALWASVFSTVAAAEASVTYDGPATGPGITETGGRNSTLIQACANDNCGFGNDVSGDAKIDAAGNLTGIGVSAPGTTGMNGLFAEAGGGDVLGQPPGDATVNYHRGTINITQTDTGIVAGIFAASGDVGSATITTDPGTTVMVKGQGSALFGIDAFASGGTATADVASTIVVEGSPTTTSIYRRNPSGIIVTTDPNAATDPIGSASVAYSGPGITVHGGGGLGIVAVAGSPGSGSESGPVTVDASGATGPIVADGSNAVGILADSGTIRNVVADGDSPTTTTGAVVVNASKIVSTPGEFGVGISATGGSGGVMVNIPSGGSIMGGWQPDVASVGTTYGLPAAGVILGSSVGAATLTNNGAIGALSDRAIASPLPSFFGTSFPTSNNTTIINSGTITGFTQLVGGDNIITNNGTFNLRHFADTTGLTDASGNGVRDTVRVAVADLGAGLGNTFTNNGTLALPQVTDAKTLDSTGEYLPVANNPLGNPHNAMGLGGPLQGQIIGAATFTNSGVIDLQSNPVPGDVMMITGGRGGSAPGTGGGGTFISNGGSLMLDTVLNEGGAATVSDTLVADGTSVGAGGATRTFIRNAGGEGDLTVGDGILVVEVLNQSRSAGGAFALAGGELEAGPWEYRLFQGGVNGSNPGDWFLRSTFIPPVPEPVPPDPPVPLPPGVDPIIGPDLATFGVVQPLARQLGLTTLGTLHERVGDTYAPDCSASPAPETSGVDLPTKKPAALPTKKAGPAPCPLFSPSAWARFFGGTTDNRYQAFAEPETHGNFWGFQGGVDLLRGPLIPGGYDRAGLYGAYSNSNNNVDGLVTNPAATAYIFGHTGSVNLDAWSGGAYWTHIGPSGWYLDAVLQGTVYSGHAATPESSLTTDGTGFIASLEGGYPIPLWFWPQLVLEPQGQILWQHVGFNHEFDGFQNVSLGSTNGPTGRLGLLAKSTIVTASGQVWQPYVRGNIWESWGAQATTTFGASPIQVPLLEQATWLEFAAGGTVKVNANWSAYAQAGYQFAVAPSNVQRNGFTGDIGLRYTW
jgi:outer membrane autotransporter protein